jgi:hypothetical protein
MGLTDQIKAGSAYVEASLRDAGLKRGLQSINARIKAFSASIAIIGTKGIALVAAPMLAAGKIASDLGSDLADLSQRTGVSVEALSELGFAAGQSGSSMEELENGIKFMQKALAGIDDDSANKLAELGLSAEKLRSMSPDQQLMALGDAINQIGDPAKRTATALEIFGRGGAKLLPLFADGARGMNELRQQARDLGIVVSTESATAAEAFGDKLSALGATLRMGVYSIGSAIIPILGQMADGFLIATSNVVKWLSANQSLVVLTAAVAGGFVTLGAALLALGSAMLAVNAVIATTVTAVTALSSAFVFVATNPITAFIGSVGLAAAALARFTTDGQNAVAMLGADATKAFGDVDRALTALVGRIGAGDLAGAAELASLAIQRIWLQLTNNLRETWVAFTGEFTKNLNAMRQAVASTAIDIFTRFRAASVFVLGKLGAPGGATGDRLQQFLDQDRADAENTKNEIANIFAAENAAVDAATQEKLRSIEMQLNAATDAYKKALTVAERANDVAREQAGIPKAAGPERGTPIGWAVLWEQLRKRSLVDGLKLAERVGAFGTFSGRAASGFGVVDARIDKIVKATEETAKNTRNRGGIFLA